MHISQVCLDRLKLNKMEHSFITVDETWSGKIIHQSENSRNNELKQLEVHQRKQTVPSARKITAIVFWEIQRCFVD